MSAQPLTLNPPPLHRPSWGGLLSLWVALARTGALTWLAYRLTGMVKLAEFPFLIAVYTFIFQALYASLPEGQTEVGGMVLAQTLTYITLVWILDGLLVNPLDWELAQEMRDGHVAVYFARPVSMTAFTFFQTFGTIAVRVVFFALPLALVAALFGNVAPPASAQHALLFVGLLFGAGVIRWALNFLIGLSALFLENNSGLMIMKIALVRGAGGLVIPLTLLPANVQDIVMWTPFPYPFFVPVQAYLGREDWATLWGWAGMQVVWALVLTCACILLELAAKRRVHLQGG